MKYIGFLIIIATVLLSISACGQKNSPEAGGQALLAEARGFLSTNNYAAAKGCIEKMRKQFPLALNAREEGILLLDSINLAEARVQLEGWKEKMQQPGLSRISKDTMDFNRDEALQKVRFFEKKIIHDKAAKKQHGE